MESNAAHKTILFCAAGTFALGWFNSAKNGHELPSTKFLVGGATAFGVISILADEVPQVAGPLALAIFTTALLNDGGGILKYMNDHGEVSSKKTSTKKSTTAAAQPAAPTTVEAALQGGFPVTGAPVTAPLATPRHESVGQIPGLNIAPTVLPHP